MNIFELHTIAHVYWYLDNPNNFSTSTSKIVGKL